MIGYPTQKAAVAAAHRRKAVGLTGSGQECCPVQFADGSWGYWAAHDYFHPWREPGVVILPGREMDPTTEEAELLFGGEEWMAENMFPPASWRR